MTVAINDGTSDGLIGRRSRPTRGFDLWRALKPYLGTPLNAVITLACLALLAMAVKALIAWLFVNALFEGGPQDCKVTRGIGACWPYFQAKLRFMTFGFYPYEQHWRPFAAMLIFLSSGFITMLPRFWNRTLLVLWPVSLLLITLLMWGGFFGLVRVPVHQWGGLPLSFMLSFVGLVCAFPLGIVLALGRMSRLPAIRILCVVFIEIIRGVPLISILFMASVMLPLFMPEGVNIDKLLRAQIAIILFAAAYIAETVRGGLQAIPKGQFEAAGAMGLHYWQMMRLIVLPQALKIVIPPLVTTFIGFFQDTTLVTIIGLFDFLDTVRGALRDPAWQGIAVLEAYLFAAFVYLVFSWGMGGYSRFLERRFHVGH
jgi:general L-amino acid transport system permease protein